MTIKWSRADLFPNGDDLYSQAHGSLYGDPAWENDGVHSGKDPFRKDTQGLSKLDVIGKVGAKDLNWFDALAARLRDDPHQLPASLRSRILKDLTDPSRGRRPIDDVAEFKRLVTLHVRAKLGERIEQVLHPGQLGGRPKDFTTPLCPKESATAQDHVAWGILQAVRVGYSFAVLIDLKGAFGNIPKMVVVRQLQRLGLAREAALWVWRLVRIDALDARTGRPVPRKLGRGIEQGNPLSPAIMNLVLAPVLHDLTRLDVQVFAYLDDIYIMAWSAEGAVQAFRRFKKAARGLGFTGIRPLVEGEVEPGSKATRIIDTATKTVPVLRTYEIDSNGISLADEKALEAVEQALKVNPASRLFRGVGKLRKVSHCQALTAAAVRARNSKYLHPPHPGAGVDEAAPEVSPAPTALGGGRTVPLTPAPFGGRGSSTSRGERHRNPPHGDGERCARTGTTSPSVGRATVEQNSRGEATRPLDTYRARALSGCGRDGVSGGLATGGMGSRACAPSCGSPTPSGGVTCGDAEVVLSAERISARSERNGCIQDQMILDSSRSNRPYGRAGTSPGSQGRSRGVLTVALLPEVLAAVHEGRPIKIGNLWKGQILDFTGFGKLVEDLPPGKVRLIVNTLFRAARLNRQVKVMFDPKEDWQWSEVLLGMSPQTVFKQEGELAPLPGGQRQATLVAPRSKRPDSLERPDEADLVFLRAGRPNRASLRAQAFFLDEDGRRRSRSFTATSPALPTAALEALLALALRFPGKVIAVPRKGAFATLLNERPANAHRAMAVGKIRSMLQIDERLDHLLVHRSIRSCEFATT